MLFRRKKKEEPHKGDIFLAKGIYLKQPLMDNGNIILNCFLRCLIVFLLVFGSIGGFLSAFEISYHFLLVIAFYLLLSMYFSFLYSTSKMLYRDIGYILFFGVFIGAIYFLRLYANSGFYSIINVVLKHAQTFFDLSGVREYETQISNDYLTVAVAAIFVGMVIIIILNIWIYSTMSLFWTVLLTFPLLLIPLYMKLTPDALYIIALGIGYMAVMIFKANGHYLAFAWDAPFRIKGLKKDRVTYTQDAGVFKQILLSAAILIFCMVILAETFFSSGFFERQFKNDRLRETTSESIANFVLLGFSGLYNQYASTAGMSGGMLGGIANVRPDYQTDLVVSYTPYSNEAVYLKGYTGGIYGDNQWESLYGNGRDDISVFEEESMKREAEFLENETAAEKEYSAAGKMDVYNVGADVSYLYYPYYTMFEDYSIYNNHGLMLSAQGLGVQQEKTYQYYPKIVWEDSLGEIKPEQMDKDAVNPIFLDVPEKNKTVIAQECEHIGLTSDMTENEIVDAVKLYFEENIPYTLKPGATPRKEDFINYFLTKNRKGYCAHFASAATLIFREMGIPARYVEGYAFSLETVLASDVNTEKDYLDYYKGYSGIGESAVMQVEVTDAMAHAWVEIYVEGFGWKVVEVTPGSNEVTDEDDFWSAFADFFGNPSDVDNTGKDGIELGNLNLSEFSWLIYAVILFLGCIILFFTGRIGIRKFVRYRRCHQKNQKEAVIACYADICDMLRTCNRDFNLCRSHLEQLDFVCCRYKIDFDRKKICQQLERISFSEESLSGEELEALRFLMKRMRKTIWKNAELRQKIALCRR